MVDPFCDRKFIQWKNAQEEKGFKFVLVELTEKTVIGENLFDAVEILRNKVQISNSLIVDHTQGTSLNLVKLHDQIRTSEQQVDFMQKYGILNTSHTCSVCDLVTTTVKRRPGTEYFYFECPKCHKQSSIRQNTDMYNKGISLRSYLMLAYFFIYLNLTHEQLIHETNMSVKEDEDDASSPVLSNNTTIKFTTKFRFVRAQRLRKV